MSLASGQGADGKTRPISAPGRAVKEVLAETVLEDDGSYTATDSWELPLGTPLVGVSGPYTRGAVGGRFLAKPLWKVNGAWVYDQTPSDVTVSGATVETPIGTTVIPGPVPQDGSALPFAFVLEVFPGATDVKLELAEADATKATPGTIGPVVLSGGY